MFLTSDGSERAYDYLVKFIIVGDGAVGKSSLLLRFVDDRFRHDHALTIGVDFGVRYATVDNVRLKLQLWDTAGQEAYRSVTRAFYAASAAAVLVYDVTDRQSFDNLSPWIQRVCDPQRSRPLIIVGNKTDCGTRAVRRAEGEAAAAAVGALYIETSARDGTNVEELFTVLCRSVLHGIDRGTIVPSPSSGVRPPPSTAARTAPDPPDACCKFM
jgi:Ras-related protein Rab-2A